MPDLIEGTGPNPDYGTHHSLSSEPLGERRQRLRAEQLEAELERLRLDSVEAGLLRAALGGLALRFGIEPDIERILAEIKVDAARLLEKTDA